MSTTSMHPATSASQNQPADQSQSPALPYARRRDQLVGSVLDASTTLLAQ